MSRAIIAYHSGPGEPVGYRPFGSAETRFGWLCAEFGGDTDVEQIREREQTFSSRLAALLDVDWTLADIDFDRSVAGDRAAKLGREREELLAKARKIKKLAGGGGGGGDSGGEGDDERFFRVSLEHQFDGHDRDCLDEEVRR